MKILLRTIALTLLFISYNSMADTSASIDRMMVNIKDSTITAKILAKNIIDRSVAESQISVTTDHGVVTLTGETNTDFEKTKLVQIASAVSGVKNVDASKITVKKSEHFFQDTLITAKIKAYFLKDKWFGDKKLLTAGMKVHTTNGVVYLLNAENNKKEIENVINLVKSVHGVKRVVAESVSKK